MKRFAYFAVILASLLATACSSDKKTTNNTPVTEPDSGDHDSGAADASD